MKTKHLYPFGEGCNQVSASTPPFPLTSAQILSFQTLNLFNSVPKSTFFLNPEICLSFSSSFSHNSNPLTLLFHFPHFQQPNIPLQFPNFLLTLNLQIINSPLRTLQFHFFYIQNPLQFCHLSTQFLSFTH